MCNYTTTTIIWNRITITIRYNPNYFESSKKRMGYHLVHLEVIAEHKSPLPFTESGYRSHFTNAGEIEAYGTPTDFVKAWLKETATSKKWKAYQMKQQQLTLF